MAHARHSRTACAALCSTAAALLASGAAQAQERRSHGDWDISFNVPYVESLSEEFAGTTRLNSDSAYGFGIAFDYTMNDNNWSVGGSVAFTEIDVDLDLAGTPITSRDFLTGEFDATTIMGNFTKHFGRGPVSPYAFGSVGFTYVDTNIADGPPTVGPCWWDPWWGYTCGVYQASKTSTELTYGVGIGLRWDIGRRAFVDLNVAQQWTNFDNAVDLVDYTTARLGFGFRQ